ncbi:uncharacterized protein LOC144106540 [Amblyomma americanum]
MQTIFCLCLCLGLAYLVTADEVDELKEQIETAVREHAGSEELAEKILSKTRILVDCASKHGEEGTALLRKVTLPVSTEGTKCVATKSDISDPTEKELAERQCYKEASEKAKKEAGLTEKENLAYDGIKACFLASLTEAKV